MGHLVAGDHANERRFDRSARDPSPPGGSALAMVSAAATLYVMSTVAERIRCKVSGWRAAEERARSERGNLSLTPAEALEAAEEIRALNPAAFEGADPVREREVADVRRAWARVRERWRRRTAR